MIWLLGCFSQEPVLVTLSGVITESSEADAVGASEVLVETLGPTYEPVDEGTTDGRGFFEAEVIANTAMYVTFSGEGFDETSFTGFVGSEDFSVDDGVLYMRSSDEVDALHTAMLGCPYAGAEDVAVVEGEVRFHLPGYEVDDGDWPLAATAYTSVTDSDGVEYEPCYFDAAGLLYDSEAEVTGDAGRFAVFGDFSGPITLGVGYEVEGEPYFATSYQLHVSEGGIAPVYPAYVPLPQ